MEEGGGKAREDGSASAACDHPGMTTPACTHCCPPLPLPCRASLTGNNPQPGGAVVRARPHPPLHRSPGQPVPHPRGTGARALVVHVGGLLCTAASQRAGLCMLRHGGRPWQARALRQRARQARRISSAALLSCAVRIVFQPAVAYPLPALPYHGECSAPELPLPVPPCRRMLCGRCWKASTLPTPQTCPRWRASCCSTPLLAPGSKRCGRESPARRLPASPAFQPRDP